MKISRIRRPVAWLLVLLGVLAATVASRRALGVAHGLQTEYFANDSRSGAPVFSRVSAEISTAGIVADWSGAPPPVFSARWFGYLVVGRSGVYTFSLSSDDGSTLEVDGKLLIDNGGPHGIQTRTGRVTLARGPHLVVVRYDQVGGEYELGWAWARDGGRLTSVPGWRLSPTRIAYSTALAARALDVLAVLVACGALVVFGVFPDARAPAVRVVDRYPRAASLAVFIALAVLHTWPLASDPAHLSRNDNGDTMLNEWILAWVARQAVHAPLNLFDANIFHPESNTLAYSESLIVQSAMGAPLLWLGASPVLTYNLVLIAGFVLTGWTMSLVVSRWTGDRVAGITAGSLAAFNAHNLTRLPHLQTQHMEFLPLALLALDALLREPRAGHALRLAWWFTLQALTSIHLLIFSAVAMVAATVVRPDAWSGGARFRRLAPQVALAAAVAALILTPFLLPYWQLYRQGAARPLADAGAFAATWPDFLGTPGRLHLRWWSHRWFTGVALFPGVTALALTGLAIASGKAFKDPRARMCLAFGVCGLVLSFGTNVPGYAILYHVVPILGAIRAVSRFAVLGLLAIAVLAGFGMAVFRRSLPPRFQAPLSALAVALVVIEPLAAPLGLSRFDGIPAIYDQLRSEANAVVVEMPFPPPRSWFQNAGYMLNSTRHWKPMLNGYSGFEPPSYERHYESLRTFPSAQAIAGMRTAGVTHVFVHLDHYGAELGGVLEGVRELRKIASDGSITLYRLEASGSPGGGLH